MALQASDALAASAPSAQVTTPTEQFDGDEILSLSTPSINKNNYHAHRQNHNPSKLPAFRFADLKDSLKLPSLYQQHQSHASPPTPVSPDLDQHDNTIAQPNIVQNNNNNNNSSSSTVSPEQSTTTVSPKSSPARSRASTFQTATTSIPATPSANVKRSLSLDLPTAAAHVTSRSSAHPDLSDLKSPTESTTTIVVTRSQTNRATASYTTNGVDAASGPPSTLSSQRLHHSSEGNQSSPPSDEVTKDWAQGQRELLLPITVQSIYEKKNSIARRPPVSYRPPVNASGVTTSIPPIRSFRSSGSRRSLVLDMNIRNSRSYDGGDLSDSNHRDKTLRALEGRHDDDGLQLTPPRSATDRSDFDDSGDVFLKIAREEQHRVRAVNENPSNAVSRVVRSMHRRPLSTAITPTYQPSSPPRFTRRLSDQQDTSRAASYGDDQPAERMARLTYRGMTGEGSFDDAKAKGSGSPLRPSPLTPRSLASQEFSQDNGSAYSPRRQSITDFRHSSYRQPGVTSYAQSRTYNSSPLVPRSMDFDKNDVRHGEHGPDGTESSASTAAPSTVWDELDEMKSRIRRLELTGKLPQTSGAAVSRATDERPPTATTNATTMSGSPKHNSGSAVQKADVISTVSSHTREVRENHPLLQSALNKSKPFLGSNVFGALETAANDALALSQMIGPAGQAGPIASGASAIGSNGNVTDRKLRRKAHSICRSLTELCLALNENAAQVKPQPGASPVPAPAPKLEPEPELESPSSPTITKFSGFTTQRRPGAAIYERSPAALTTSPRALSRLEEKRSSMLFSALPTPSPRYSANTPTLVMPSPRYSSATTPSTPVEGPSRRTSLMVSRTRRAVTEEPEEEEIGRKSSMLRTRRAGTAELEESASGRKTSLHLRTRRAAVENEEDDTQIKAPERSVTEAATPKYGFSRDFSSQMPIPSIENSFIPSALPRRRMPSTSSTFSTRLVQVSGATGLGTRRYFDRTTPDRENFETVVEERLPTRHLSLGQNMGLGRTASVNKRISSIATSSKPTQCNGYR